MHVNLRQPHNPKLLNLILLLIDIPFIHSIPKYCFKTAKSRAASWSSRIQYVDILSGCTSVHPYNLGGNLFFAIPSNFALHLNARWAAERRFLYNPLRKLWEEGQRPFSAASPGGRDTAACDSMGQNHFVKLR